MEVQKITIMLRLKEVMRRTGLGKTTIYKLIKAGLFPASVKLVPGGRAVGFPEHLVQAFIDGLWLAVNDESVGANP